MTFDTWESYFYPETYNPRTLNWTMRNLYGERDAGTLHHLEYGAADRRSIELRVGIADVPRTYDAEHIRAIHGYVFQDVYEWAGDFRTVNMSKSWPPELGQGYTDFLAADRIGSYLDEVQQRVAGVPWADLDRNQFAHAAADIFSWTNYAHPMREGNGRTVKMFMQHVAELSRFELNYNPQLSGVTPELWNRASALTSPDPGSTRPVPDAMVPIFQQLSQPRQTPIRQLDIAGERERAKTEQKRPTLSERIAKGVRELRTRSDDADPGRDGRGRGPGGR